jgi:hypothetical protein
MSPPMCGTRFRGSAYLGMQLLGLVLATGAALLVLWPAPAGASGVPAFVPRQAEAVGTGSISGTVSGGIKGAATCSLSVMAYDSGGAPVEELDPFGGNYYDPYSLQSAGFAFKNLEPGNYRLGVFERCVVRGPDWTETGSDFTMQTLTEYFSDQPSLEAATPISVVAGTSAKVWINLDGPDPEIPAPDAVIDSGPSGTITTDNATFEFSSSDPANTAGFECRLDNEAFTDCASPKTFSSLSDGQHVVAVRAEHAVAGHEDQTSATRTFTVDVPDPEARIGKVIVKGPAKVQRGKKATYRVRITNSGGAAAAGVKVRARARGTSAISSVGKIARGATRAAKVKLNLKKPGKSKLTVRVTSSNAGGKSVKRVITVRK